MGVLWRQGIHAVVRPVYLGGMIDEISIRFRYQLLIASLNERGRRLSAAAEARAAGHGGIAGVARTTGLARSTIGRGLEDMEARPLTRARFARRRWTPPAHANRPDAAGGFARHPRTLAAWRSHAALAVGYLVARSLGDAGRHSRGLDYVTRTKLACPSSRMRLSDLTAIATPVTRRASSRDFNVSPMTRL